METLNPFQQVGMETLNPLQLQSKLLKISKRMMFIILLLYGGKMSEIRFKERVRDIAIDVAQGYKRYYVDYEYLICSEAFKVKRYYIIDAKEDNFQHLLGINSPIKPKEFFQKCLNGTLQEMDFDFNKRGIQEQSVKGSVRKKIQILHNMLSLFHNECIVEEGFSRNKLCCSFAAADNTLTLGFISAVKSYPMTLLKGNLISLRNGKKLMCY